MLKSHLPYPKASCSALAPRKPRTPLSERTVWHLISRLGVPSP